VPAIIDKLLRIGEGKILRQLEAVSRAVNAIEDDFVAMTDAELQAQTAEFKCPASGTQFTYKAGPVERINTVTGTNATRYTGSSTCSVRYCP